MKLISSQYIPCDTRNVFIIFCSFEKKTSVTSLFLKKSSLLLLVIIRWCSQQHFDACYEISAHCFILPSHPQKTARSRLDRHCSLSEHANRSPSCTSPSKQWWPCTLITASLHCLVCIECRETGSKSETFDPFYVHEFCFLKDFCCKCCLRNVGISVGTLLSQISPRLRRILVALEFERRSNYCLVKICSAGFDQFNRKYIEAVFVHSV